MKTIPGAPRTPEGQAALALYNDVQLCHELHWTYQELNDTPEEFVWAVMTVLSAESEKMEEEMSRNGGGRKSPMTGQRVEIPPPPPPSA
jgi:hypothetical protein